MVNFTGHGQTSFDQELSHLSEMIVSMGRLAEKELTLATEAVLRQDREAAEQAIALDPQIDRLEKDAEHFSVRLLALRQPVAGDLRQIVTTLKISVHLERVGDYAANVAKRSRSLTGKEFPQVYIYLEKMLKLVAENLHLLTSALAENDTDKALAVWYADEKIDEEYAKISQEMMSNGAENMKSATHLLFIAKNLERIGDHATNIAESLYYTVTGNEIEGQRPKKDYYSGQ